VAGLSTTVTLQWSVVADAGYWVCWDTSNNNSCDNGWFPNGGGNTRTLGGLANGTYYWQVRAQTAAGNIDADSGTWFSFTVGAAQGGFQFGKVSPSSGTTGASSSPTLTWAAVSGAGYYVCYDTTNNNSCDSAWFPNGGGTSRQLSGLAPGTYYWQVKANNGGPDVEADSGTWWSFTVGAQAPSGLNKLGPSNGSGGLPSLIALSWTAVPDSGYWVCVDTVNNNACDTAWFPNGGGTSRQVGGLAPGTYYWQVRSQNSAGLTDADGGAWSSFTVTGPTPDALSGEPTLVAFAESILETSLIAVAPENEEGRRWFTAPSRRIAIGSRSV